jgi:fucose 4-O-acetylase-like acetyltransferase
VAKGLGILLVILGHSLRNDVMPSGAVNWVIYSFHMPAFFMLSGYVYSAKPLTKRVRRLLIPYAVFTLISVILGFGWTNQPIYSYVLRPNPGIWFLYTLFECLLIADVASRWRWGLAAAVIVSIVGVVVGAPVKLGLDALAWYFPFFALGVSWKGKPFRVHWAWPVLFGLALWALWMSQPSLPGKVVLALTGGLTLATVATLLSRTRMTKWLEWTGRSSLDLYLASGLLLGVWLFVLGRDLPSTLLGSAALAAVVSALSAALSLALRGRTAQAATTPAPVPSEPQDEAA